MSDITQFFGLTVRRLREAHDWSQEELAEKANLNRSYLGEVERGKAIPSLITLEKLADALGVSVADLLAQCEQLRKSRFATRLNLASIAC